MTYFILSFNYRICKYCNYFLLALGGGLNIKNNIFNQKKLILFFSLILAFIVISLIGYAKYDRNIKKLNDVSKTFTSTIEEQKNNVRSEDKIFNGGFVTFIDDDGIYTCWTKLMPIFKEKGVPAVTAMITSIIDTDTGLSTEQLLSLQDMGWEVASHTVNHSPLAELSLEDQEEELKLSKEILESKGINCENIVYPYGSYTEETETIAKKYYDRGVAVNDGRKLNNYPLNDYSLTRISIGSYYDYGENTDTLEYYKSQVDSAINNNGWVIFMIHSAETDDSQLSYISELIDYCKEKNAPIVTLKDGLKAFNL